MGRDRCDKRKALAALLTGAAVLAVGISGCSRRAPAVSTDAAVSSQAQEEVPAGAFEETDPDYIVRGNSGTMVESSSSLFFKYEDWRGKNTFWRIDKKTGKEELLYTFDPGTGNSLFWYYNGSLYFDVDPAPDSSSQEKIGLYQLKVKDREAVRLMDLTALPTMIYAADHLLYVKGYGMENYYSLKDDGSLDGELRRENTVYGKIPSGCDDLYRESIPSIAARCGYLAMRRDNTLVIADLDGSNERTVEGVTDLSDLVFDKDSFFAVLEDKNQKTIVKYDVHSLKPEPLLSMPHSPTLLQYYDGRLYYMVGDSSDPFVTNNTFYSIAEGEKEAQAAAIVKTDPGTTKFYGYYGGFYVAEGSVYVQAVKDYDLYILKSPMTGVVKEGKEGETDSQGGIGELLKPAVYQSGIKELGRVTAEDRRLTLEGSDAAAARYYVETLVLNGSSDAVKQMNQVLEAASKRQVENGKKLTAMVDEQQLSLPSFSPPSLQYKISGITYLDSRYFCAEADGSEYTGGSRDMPSREFFIFDRQTGKQLGLTDLIATPMEQLKQIVAAHFKKYAEQTNGTFETPEELEQTVYGRVNERSPFYLTPEGVVFYFAPYDIAPAAAGFPEVTVPYSELSMKVQLEGK